MAAVAKGPGLLLNVDLSLTVYPDFIIINQTQVSMRTNYYSPPLFMKPNLVKDGRNNAGG